MNDEEIIARCFARDETALAGMAERYGTHIRAIAFRILGDPQDALECENDTYLEAWNAIPPRNPQGYLSAFLGRIARNLALDRCRRMRAAKRSALYTALTKELEECIPGGDDPEALTDSSCLGGLIDEFLEDCPAWQRDIFLRRYWYFDSVREISERYGYTESRVKTTLFRMRERMKKHLNRGGYAI